MGRTEGLKECGDALVSRAVRLGILRSDDPLVAHYTIENAASALQLLSGTTNEDDQASMARIVHEEASIVSAQAESRVGVVAAVEALRRGTYGKCQACGLDIPLERLHAVPEALVHVKCPPPKKTAKKKEAAEA